MAGRGGRGRGCAANDPPPPPDYMAAMMQQFELNRQFMENVVAQFPQPNQHGHHHQHATVTLHDFTRLNPTLFCNSVQPLDADDLSGPGVSVCKPRYNTIIWRSEN